MFEIALRVGFAIAVVLGVPWLGLGLSRAVLGFRKPPLDPIERGERWAVLRGCVAGAIAFAIPFGANAIAVTRPDMGPTRPIASALVLTLVALVGSALFRFGKRDLGLAEQAVPFATLARADRILLTLALVVGGAVALGAGRRLGVVHGPVPSLAYIGGSLLFAHGVARHPVEGLVVPAIRSRATAVGIALVLVPCVATTVLFASTAIDASDVMRVDEETAARRVFLVPHDTVARLALAWADAREGKTESARAGLARAEAIGADRVEVALLESELHALADECDQARAAFHRALELRAERDLERVLDERLSLGSYRLPPSLVGRCGVAPRE